MLPYKVHRNVLDLISKRLISDSANQLYNHEKYYGRVNKEEDNTPYLFNCAFQWYGFPLFESLMIQLQPYAESFADHKLLPTYSAIRCYGNGSFLRSHLDRPACEISITYCVEPEPEYPYPIGIEDFEGNMHEIVLDTGDFLIYHGTKLKHWRDEYQGNEHKQAFLHYVRDVPENQHLKYDGRPALGFASGDYDK